MLLEDGVFAVMACADAELGYAGLKSYAWLAPRGTPFVVVLFSLEEAAWRPARGGDAVRNCARPRPRARRGEDTFAGGGRRRLGITALRTTRAAAHVDSAARPLPALSASRPSTARTPSGVLEFGAGWYATRTQERASHGVCRMIDPAQFLRVAAVVT
jgi:hypothetical protein